MNASCGVLISVLASVLPRLANAQSPGAGMPSRQPTIIDSAADTRFREVLTLKMARIAQALVSADSGAVQSALDQATPSLSETSTTRASGCVSLGWMLTEARRVRGLKAGAVLGDVRMSQGGLSPFVSDSAVADLSVADHRDSATVHVHFRRDNDALVVAQADGLFTALCRVAARRKVR